ncbi:MAG: hypothetical protein STHCBS139747_002740 [Sporothrix thermara]
MPALLPANQPPARFYKGGRQISTFRGDAIPFQDPCFVPEDWVGSTTSCTGSHPLGLTRLPDGTLLADAVRQDPEYWLGADHVRAFGVDTKLLVKLLDAGQRLPVHAHPHDGWVSQHLPTQAHGKAEAWYILTPGEVYLGLQDDVDAATTLKQLTLEQHIHGPDGLLGRLHRLDVKPGDAVYVPPGWLHAVGQGVLLVEVQEPADLSILLEWAGFDLDGMRDGHLGLGWDTALTAVDCCGHSREQVAQLVVTREKRKERQTGSKSVFVEASEEYFMMEEVYLEGNTATALVAGFSLLVVLEESLLLGKGNTVLLAHGEGEAQLLGRGLVLVARPPKAE